MGLMRNFFLWASVNQTLKERLPRYGFIKKAVSRFMPGEELEDALKAAEDLRGKGLATVFTRLGENIVDEEEAREVSRHYCRVLDQIHDRNLDCHISVKLTQLGFDLNQELCYANLLNIVKQAAKLNNYVWIDMESTPYVDGTLNMYRRIRSVNANVGVCVQSYLYRTLPDLETLQKLSPGIRLVKGAYAEPPDLAFRDKKDVDENYFKISEYLLNSISALKVRLAIGTHDTKIIRKIIATGASKGLPKNSFEFHMLYGIRREEQLRLRKEGYPVRVLISYGSFWFPWYMRRLAERPANVLFVLKNLFVD
jgi:proline dehydrogenase